MKALIVGAGIAGLVAARQLGLAGWEVDVLEKSPGPRRDGYMMDFFGPGVEAAGKIGLYPRLAAVAYRVDDVEYVDTAGNTTARLDYEKFSRLAGGNVLSLLRPDMERAAFAALEDVPAGRGAGPLRSARFQRLDRSRRRTRGGQRRTRCHIQRGRPARSGRHPF